MNYDKLTLVVTEYELQYFEQIYKMTVEEYEKTWIQVIVSKQLWDMDNKLIEHPFKKFK